MGTHLVDVKGSLAKIKLSEEGDVLGVSSMFGQKRSVILGEIKEELKNN